MRRRICSPWRPRGLGCRRARGSVCARRSSRVAGRCPYRGMWGVASGRSRAIRWCHGSRRRSCLAGRSRARVRRRRCGKCSGRGCCACGASVPAMSAEPSLAGCRVACAQSAGRRRPPAYRPAGTCRHPRGACPRTTALMRLPDIVGRPARCQARRPAA